MTNKNFEPKRDIQKSFAEIDFVKTLENIRNHCLRTKFEDCPKCKLNNNGYRSGCVLHLLATELKKFPYDWNIEKIKEILGE